MSAIIVMKVYLLILSLITGSSNQQLIGCSGGWLKFTCRQDPHNDIFPINKTKITKNEDDSFTVVVKDLNKDDRVVSCESRHRPVPIGNCSLPTLDHTTYKKAQTTIACGYPENRAGPLTFLCKETSDYECEDVERINTKAKYSRNETGLNITITEVSAKDRGNYWCVAKGENFNRTYRKVFVDVLSNFEDIRVDLVTGQDIQHRFSYRKKHIGKSAFVCKGEDPSMCQHLVNITNEIHGKYELLHDEADKDIHVTIKNVTEEDEGVYWFGAERPNRKGIKIFSRLELRRMACVTAVSLVMLLVVVLKCYKRKHHSSDQNKMEDNVYEEILDAKAERTVSTVYATAQACKDSVQYATLDFDKLPKSTRSRTSASYCEYNAVFTKTPKQ